MIPSGISPCRDVPPLEFYGAERISLVRIGLSLLLYEKGKWGKSKPIHDKSEVIPGYMATCDCRKAKEKCLEKGCSLICVQTTTLHFLSIYVWQ